MVKLRYFNNTRVRRPLTLAIIAGILGLLILVAALVSLNRTRVFLAASTPIQAQVVAMQVDRSGKLPSYLPMFSFRDRTGKQWRLPGWQSSPEYGFARGEMVTILFNPDMPDKVRIDAWRDGWNAGLNILFVAGFFLAMAVGGLILHRRWARERPNDGARTQGAPDPEDNGVTTVFYNEGGILRVLRRPKLAAIMLAIPGFGMLTAGLYGVAAGTDGGTENQTTAYLSGAVLFLGIAAWALSMHLKQQRARARHQRREK